MKHQVIIDIGIFFRLFAVFAVSERIAPRISLYRPVNARWITHFSITVINTMILKLMLLAFPFIAFGAAFDAVGIGCGLFNVFDWPLWIEILLYFLILDFAIWAQHLIAHKAHIFFKLHRVHDARVDSDVSTAIQFHPVELALSIVLKIGLVYLLGPIAWAVILFEVALNVIALLNQTTISIPAKFEPTLRRFIAKPDMHRILYSVQRKKHDCDCEFSVSVRNLILGAYWGELARSILTGLQWQDGLATELRWSRRAPPTRT